MSMPGVTAVLVLLTGVAATVAPVANQTDDIRIVSLEPQGPVAAGVETEFTIWIDVDLESTDEAYVHVGFNIDSPGTYRMVGSRELRSGRQQLRFVVSVVPVDWGDRGDFQVMANVGPATSGGGWTPTAWVHKTIPVKH
jgi:hypothetical protein